MTTTDDEVVAAPSAKQPFDVAWFGARAREHRRARGLNLRDAAAEAGVSFNTLSRVERGGLCDLAGFARLVQWIGIDANLLLYREDPS